LTAVLLFALWTDIALFVGVVVGQMIRRADEAEAEQDEASNWSALPCGNFCRCSVASPMRWIRPARQPAHGGRVRSRPSPSARTSFPTRCWCAGDGERTALRRAHRPAHPLLEQDLAAGLLPRGRRALAVSALPAEPARQVPCSHVKHDGICWSRACGCREYRPDDAGKAIPARFDERYDPSPEPIDRSIQ
jgi:hypothetical protein